MPRPNIDGQCEEPRLVLVVVSPLSAGGGQAVQGIPEQGILEQGILEQIVVTVNGDVITKTEIDERLRVTRALTGDGVAAGVDPELLTRVLRDAVDERLMTQRAAELGLDVRDEDVDRVLAAVRAESHVDSDAAFNEFEGVAEAFSESASKASGGLVGPVEPDALEPSVLAALKALEPGAISASVETSDGYCFLKMEGMDAASAPTFRGNREPIVEMLLAMKQRAALEDLVGRLRGSAILQWKRRDLQAAYERPSR